MTKPELIAKVAAGVGETKSLTRKVVDAFLLSIEGALACGE